MEPLDNMVQDWPNEVKKNCEKSKEMEEIFAGNMGTYLNRAVLQ